MNKFKDEFDAQKDSQKKSMLAWVIITITIFASMIFQVISMIVWNYDFSSNFVFLFQPILSSVAILIVIVLAMIRFKRSK